MNSNVRKVIRGAAPNCLQHNLQNLFDLFIQRMGRLRLEDSVINVARIVVSATPVADENRAVKLLPLHPFGENSATLTAQ